jgi:hypothetical protein
MLILLYSPNFDLSCFPYFAIFTWILSSEVSRKLVCLASLLLQCSTDISVIPSPALLRDVLTVLSPDASRYFTSSIDSPASLTCSE